MKKGDYIWTRSSEGGLARFLVTGTTEHGVNGIWQDGALKGKEASVEKQTLSEMAAAAKRGAAARRRDEDEDEDAFDREVPEPSPEIVAQGEAEAAACDDVPDEPNVYETIATGIGMLVGTYTEETSPLPEPVVATIPECAAADAAEADAKKEALRAAARERVRKWRAAKKAVKA